MACSLVFIWWLFSYLYAIVPITELSITADIRILRNGTPFWHVSAKTIWLNIILDLAIYVGRLPIPSYLCYVPIYKPFWHFPVLFIYHWVFNLFYFSIPEMAAQLFNRIGQLGLGVAVVGGVINSALYNGKYVTIYKAIFCDLCM